MNIQAPLYVTAVCLETKQIMLGGLFRLHDQVGFPIDCSIEICKEKGYLIDWYEALCDCWLNDCLKFDSFVRQVNSQLPELDLANRFSATGSIILAQFPKMSQCLRPVDIVCRYTLAMKKLRKFSIPDSSGTLPSLK